MKGLFPFLRELFFGPKKPECAVNYCYGRPDARCRANQCADHCGQNCGVACVDRRTFGNVEAERRAARRDDDWPDDLGVVG